MSKIKLLKVNITDDGVMRLQSQLYVGRDTVDFILKDGVLMNWGSQSGGCGFYPSGVGYEIVESVGDMREQAL